MSYCNYNKIINIEFDSEKSTRNESQRGLPFELVKTFVWETAVFFEDNRNDYCERRIVALGFIELRLHVICFTPIDDGVRIISFRKANKRELRNYEQEILNR